MFENLEQNLEKSSEVQERIDAVRHMPQESVEEKVEKKQEAKLLRMEAWLDNASLGLLTVNSLEDNPDTTKDALLEKVQKSGQIVHPKEMQRFIDSVTEISERIPITMGFLKLEAERSKEDLNVATYRALLPHFKKIEYADRPKGKVVVTKHPLAIRIEIEDEEDFKAIDPRTNVGGFYSKEPTFYGGNTIHGSPIMVIKGLSQSSAIRHETGHAEHQALKASLSGSEGGEKEGKHLLVWGRMEEVEPPRERLEEIVRLIGKGVSYEEIQKTDQWNFVLDWALSKAKDELLAEVKPASGNPKWHIGNLKDVRGLYNYFGQAGVVANTELENRLWEDYTKRLDTVTKSAVQLHDFYANNPRCWQKRMDQFRWVLAQIPITEWEEQLNKTMFFEEMEAFNDVEQTISVTRSLLKPSYPKQLLSQDEVKLDLEVFDFEGDFFDLVQRNSEKPLYHDLKDLNTRALAFEEEAKKTVTARISSERTGLTRDVRRLLHTVEGRYQVIVDMYKAKIETIKGELKEGVVGYSEGNIQKVSSARARVWEMTEEANGERINSLT